jgi:uncharacterized protein YndB with AHSA1/START domain
MSGITATAEVRIAASPDAVWRTLTDPAAIEEFMFGTTVVTDWQPGSPEVPENYHTLTYTLDAHDGGTALSFTQDNNPSQNAANRSQANWQQMLESVKRIAESGRSER